MLLLNTGKIWKTQKRTAKISKSVKVTLAGQPDWKDTIMTFQQFLDQFKNKKHPSFLSETDWNHVFLCFSFIFAVAAYFMSTNKAGKKQEY